jgi:DNA-binding transcriptional MerR regulator/methylmalonyl-CoA mutase cobalamin-binding subunit
MTASLRYPIAAAARLTSLSIDTLRAWERRYAAVVPERGARGRVYTEAQIARLRQLSALVRHGHAISGIAGLSDSRLGRLLARSSPPPDRDAPTGGPPEPSPVARIITAIDRFDHVAADREVARLAALHTSRTFVHEVALPLMRDAGERWHRGAWTVAQEHMLSAILRAVVAGMARIEPMPDGAPCLVFATPDSEQHEFGILAAAMLAAASRLGVVYLGPSLPPDEIAGAAERAGAAVAVVGVTGGSAAVIRQLAAIRHQVGPQTEVWVGGPPGLQARVPAGARKRLLVLESFEAYERHLSRLGAR